MFYIFNDIHIGDDRSNDNLDLLYKTLNSLNKKGTIILNGDCIDLIRCEKFDERHFKFIDLINQFYFIIYVVGNHDYNVRKKLKNSKFLFVNEFSFVSGGKKIKILHGHKVDFFAKKWPITSKIVIGINSFIYKIFGLDMERKIKNIKFLRKIFFKKQKNKLIKMYKDEFDYLISGHTHCAYCEELEINGKIFSCMNCGDWIDHCAYGVIENGEMRLELVK